MRYLIVALLLSAWPVASLALTVDEIYQLQLDAYNRAKAKGERLSAEKPDTLGVEQQQPAPKTNSGRKAQKAVKAEQHTAPASPEEPVLPASTKYSNNKKAAVSQVIHHDRARTVYLDRSEQHEHAAYSGAVVLDQVKIEKRVYGIPLGSVIKGVIRRNFSSAEPGLIGIFTTDSVQGKRRILPAGTQLFAQAYVNPATKRIELHVVKGITPAPESYEFKLQGQVRDADNVSGIAGIVDVDTGNIVQHGVNKGLIAAGKSAISSIADNSVVGSAVGAGADTMLNDSNNVMEQNVQTNIIIYASAQAVKIRVENTF